MHLGRRGARRRVSLLRTGRFVWVAAVAMVVGCGSSCGIAQRVLATGDGAIHGVARDARGAALGGAKVSLWDAAVAVGKEATSGEDGQFLLAHVPAGTYRLMVEAQAERATVPAVAVQAGKVSEMETWVGSPEPEVLERVAGELNLWAAEAGVADPLLSFGGMAPTQNSSRMDGVDADQSYGAVPSGTGDDGTAEAEERREGGEVDAAEARHAGAPSGFAQAAVREFRISDHSYSAEYGHAGGGVAMTLTKSGSDRVHGMMLYQLRSSLFAAKDPFAVATHYGDGGVTTAAVKPSDLEQRFVALVSGPARRDRVFYFYTFELFRRGFPAVSSPLDPNFYALTATQQALLGTRGVRPAQTSAALRYLDSLTGVVARRADQATNFAKFDWDVAPRHRLSVQYNRVRASSPAGLKVEPVVDRGLASIGDADVTLDRVVGRWMWLRSSAMSFESRVQFARDLQSESAQQPLPQEAAVGPGGYAPEVLIGPQGFQFGTPASLGRKAYPDERRFELDDLLSWQHGHHLLQFGVEFSAIHDEVSSLTNTTGTFHYDSGLTGGHAGGLVDWITDYTYGVHSYPNGACPSIVSPVHYFCFRSFSQSFGEQSVSFGTQEWAGYVQEGWRVRQNLTISAGLRFEFELLPLPQRPNAALDAVFGSRGATSVFPEDRNNFGPRVSVAWEPLGSGRGMMKLGYGLYYGRLPGATIRSALLDTALPSSATHVRIVPSTVTDCPQVANQGFGYVCSYVAAPPDAVATTTSAVVFDKRFRLPVVQQGSLTLERELRKGSVVSATYLMDIDRQLPNSVDINIAGSTGTKMFQIKGGPGVAGVRDGETFVVPVYTQRVSAAFGPVTDIVSNGNATYHAVAIEARGHTRGGLELRAGWTWSKAIDFGQSAGAAPRTNGQFDPMTVLYDKGLSSFNRPHRVVVKGVWAPKVERGAGWLRAAGDGWMVVPTFVESSGRPYSYDVFGGTRLKGGHESINGSGGATYLPTVGRNTLRLPDTAKVDLRVSHLTTLRDGLQLVGSADVTNLVNRVNYSGVQQRAFLAGTPTGGVTPLVYQDAATVAAEGLNVRPFGGYTSARTAFSEQRQVLLGLKLLF